MRLAALLGLAVLFGCSAVNVSGEFTTLKDGTISVIDDIEGKLGPHIKAEESAARLRAIQAGAQWRLTPECTQLARFHADAKPGDCRLRGIRVPDPEIGAAKSAEIRIKALRDYIAILSEMMNTTSQDAVKTAATAAQDAFDNLAGEVDAPGLAATIARIEGARPRIDAAFDFAIQNARMRALKQVVTRNDDEFHTLVTALAVDIADLGENGLDAKYGQLYAAMKSAETRLRQPESDASRLAALEALQKARDDFVEYVPKSLPGRLAAVANAHSGLAARLRRNPSPQEIRSFIESLTVLADTITESEE